MLVLTRKIGEMVNAKSENMWMNVRILGVKGNQVRLGFDAPLNVTIVREELLPLKEDKQEKSNA